MLRGALVRHRSRGHAIAKLNSFYLVSLAVKKLFVMGDQFDMDGYQAQK